MAWRSLTPFLVPLILLGCVGVPPAPRSVGEGIAQAQIALDEAIDWGLELQRVGMLTTSQQETLAGIYDRATLNLRAARDLYFGVGDLAGAQDNIDMAQSGILAARRILQEADDGD